MSDVVFYAYMGLQAGYTLGRIRPVYRWRRASLRRVQFFAWEMREPHWTWPLIVIEAVVAHPVRSLRAWRRWRASRSAS